MTEEIGFTIRWDNGAYYVSIPNYKGGVVYPQSVVDDLREKLAAAAERYERAYTDGIQDGKAAVNVLEGRLSRLTAERDGARATALEEAAQLADKYHDQAWGHTEEQAAALNIASAIRVLAATPPDTDALQGGRE